MKHAKKLLAVLLALLVGIGVAAPAFAEGESIITKDLPAARQISTAYKTVTLSVTAAPPANAASPLRYQWYMRAREANEGYTEPFQPVAGATGASYTAARSPDNDDYSAIRVYAYCVVVSYDYEQDGETYTAECQSRVAEVSFYKSFTDSYRDLFSPLNFSDARHITVSILVLPFFLVLSVVMLLPSAFTFWTGALLAKNW